MDDSQLKQLASESLVKPPVVKQDENCLNRFMRIKLDQHRIEERIPKVTEHLEPYLPKETVTSDETNLYLGCIAQGFNDGIEFGVMDAYCRCFNRATRGFSDQEWTEYIAQVDAGLPITDLVSIKAILPRVESCLTEE